MEEESEEEILCSGKMSKTKDEEDLFDDFITNSQEEVIRQLKRQANEPSYQVVAKGGRGKKKGAAAAKGKKRYRPLRKPDFNFIVTLHTSKKVVTAKAIPAQIMS